MFEWIDDLYARVRPLLSDAERAELDSFLDHGGYGPVFGDSVIVAAENNMLTEEDKVMVEKILDFGLLRKAKPYFMEIIQQSKN